MQSSVAVVVIVVRFHHTWLIFSKILTFIHEGEIDRLMQERRNSIADALELRLSFINSLWPSDAIWRQGSRLTLVQVMACCLTAPSHYLNQCWLIITKVQWCSSEAVSLKKSQPSVTKISMKIIFVRFYWNLLGANELTHRDMSFMSLKSDLGTAVYSIMSTHYDINLMPYNMRQLCQHWLR